MGERLNKEQLEATREYVKQWAPGALCLFDELDEVARERDAAHLLIRQFVDWDWYAGHTPKHSEPLAALLNTAQHILPRGAAPAPEPSGAPTEYSDTDSGTLDLVERK